ncbi:MAG: hypothetical protein E7036_09665 [Opitutales bacterium]|nr:hypothetical protein [Opitutales bacterium]
MKKIIITIITFAFGVGAFAKTLNELVAEMPKFTNVTTAEITARMEYTQANKSDFVRELRAYSASELATKKTYELTDAEKVIRETLAPAYYAYGRELEIADIVGIRIAVALWWQLNGEDAYERIKTNGWKVDGIDLTTAEKRALAFLANDFDVIASMNLTGVSKTALLHNVVKVKRLLLNTSELTKAKKFCRDYQKAMLDSGISDSSDEFKSLKAIEDYLNRGILFK